MISWASVCVHMWKFKSTCKKKKANRGWAGDQEVGCSLQVWRSNPPALAACQSVFHLVTDPHITMDSCSICVTVYVNG